MTTHRFQKRNPKDWTKRPMALVPVSEWKDSLQSFKELRDKDAGRGTNLLELKNILVFII